MNRDERLEYMRQEMKKRQAMEVALLHWIEAHVPADSEIEFSLDSDYGRVKFLIPHNDEALAEIRKLMGPGWRQTFNEDPGSWSFRHIVYRHEGMDFVVEVFMFVDRPGSTCQRVQVGTKVVEQPVYEVVCS